MSSEDESEASAEVFDVSVSFIMIQEQVLRSHVKLGGHWGSAQASCMLDWVSVVSVGEEAWEESSLQEAQRRAQLIQRER